MKNKTPYQMKKCLDCFEAFLLVPLLVLFILFSRTSVLAQEVAEEIIPHAHSHNDYLKKKPLWGALKYGCASIEIDVFAHQGTLKVAHVGLGLNSKQTIDEMYFNPLFDFLDSHQWVYTNTPLVLMIDFKDSGKDCLPLLMESIAEHKQYFTYVQNGTKINAPLQLVISGHGFSYSQVSELDSIHVFVDGWIDRCTTDFPQILIERASARYGSVFSWKGKGEMAAEDEQRLKDLVDHAADCQTPLRFYAMPAKTKVWEKFLDAGVYWINMDDAKKFASFYKEYVNKKGLPIAQKTFNKN